MKRRTASKIDKTASSSKASASISKRPRIQDVAVRAEVSLGTVSAVLNGNGRVSEATRQRVRDAIASIGYSPDHYASNLARRQTKLIGVIVSNLQNPFFAETAQAMEEEAARFGYQISLMATNFSRDKHHAAVKQLLGARIAGLAVLTSEHDKKSRDLVLAQDVPAVFLDSGKPAGKLSVLRVDSYGGMRSAVDHLIQLGHRHLLFVRNSQAEDGRSLLSHRLRDRGFAAAVRKFANDGLETHIIDIPGHGADAGEKAIASTVGIKKFTAVIATTDLVAMGVYRALQARAIRIPKDVSVVGFDNTYFSRFMNPPLTSVDVSRPQISQIVVSALLDGGEGRLFNLKTELVKRDSTGKP
jgi:DNA-binding LacI/PurR family transcriptional regulator